MIHVLSSAVARSTALVLVLLLTGCGTTQLHPDIPPGALMGTEGAGRLAYTAPEDGMVYVYDVTDEQMVYSGRVEKDEMVVLNPDTERVSIADRTVSEQLLHAGNLHRLYFMPEGRVEERRIRVEETRIEER